MYSKLHLKLDCALKGRSQHGSTEHQNWEKSISSKIFKNCLQCQKYTYGK